MITTLSHFALRLALKGTALYPGCTMPVINVVFSTNYVSTCKYDCTILFFTIILYNYINIRRTVCARDVIYIYFREFARVQHHTFLRAIP